MVRLFSLPENKSTREKWAEITEYWLIYLDQRMEFDLKIYKIPVSNNQIEIFKYLNPIFGIETAQNWSEISKCLKPNTRRHFKI